VPISRISGRMPDPYDAVPPPPAGQPGHGSTTSLRRQSAWITDDRTGHYTGLFEIICCDCGDHPYLDYPDLPPRLQQIRGPYPLEAGLAAYAEHLGLVPGLHETTPGRSAAGSAGTLAAPGQPGHGRAARLRRQPTRLVDGRVEGGCTDAFEVICPSCGDHPDLDYSEVSSWLQRLRGPRTIKEGLAVYIEHIGGWPPA
jgi:hypothetical protein